MFWGLYVVLSLAILHTKVAQTDWLFLSSVSYVFICFIDILFRNHWWRISFLALAWFVFRFIIFWKKILIFFYIFCKIKLPRTTYTKTFLNEFQTRVMELQWISEPYRFYTLPNRVYPWPICIEIHLYYEKIANPFVLGLLALREIQSNLLQFASNFGTHALSD